VTRVVQRPPATGGQELRPGDVVMLPDGGMVAIERIVGEDAYVLEWQVGHGPWIYPVAELVLVS
jgi:hypothetical protein